MIDVSMSTGLGRASRGSVKAMDSKYGRPLGFGVFPVPNALTSRASARWRGSPTSATSASRTALTSGWVALPRAVNLGARNKVPLARLREVLAAESPDRPTVTRLTEPAAA